MDDPNKHDGHDDPPEARSVTYTAGAGDPVAVDWRGKRFVSGVPQMIDDGDTLEAVKTNPHFAFDGQDKAKEAEDKRAADAENAEAERVAILKRDREEMDARHEREKEVLDARQKTEEKRLAKREEREAKRDRADANGNEKSVPGQPPYEGRPSGGIPAPVGTAEPTDAGALDPRNQTPHTPKRDSAGRDIA